jgi:hypothetical protein
MRQCEIFHVRAGRRSGWKWRPLGSDGAGGACAEVYELFYECVTAARASGYAPVPALRCA